MRSIAKWILAATVMASVTACDQVDDGPSTSAEAVAKVHGVVAWADGDGAPASPHVGMIWVGMEDADVMPRMATEASALTGGSPAGFDLSVFSVPPADVLTEVEMADGSVLRYSIGMVFAFDDVDGDGTFGVDENGIAAPDRPFAFAALDWLIYLDGELTAESLAAMFKNPEAAHAGILRAHMDYCSFQMEIVGLSEPLTMVSLDPTTQEPIDLPDQDCVPQAE